MLIRSGLSILMDHPRLYFNDGCTPGSEWIGLTPLKVPRDRIWTAKDDARYISPLVGTPGYRHTIGIARVWHFIDVQGFIITAILFVIMLFDTEQWRRILPTSPLVLLQAWNTWVVLSWIVAHYISWNHPRGLQHALKSVTYPMQLLTLNRLTPQQKYAEEDISDCFWPNRKVPIRDDWKRLAEAGFETFRLKVGGFVERPVELSLADLEKLGETEHITMHHCIQGWSGIARWGGIPMKALIDLVQSKPEARVVAFFPLAKRSTVAPITTHKAWRMCSWRNAFWPRG